MDRLILLSLFLFCCVNSSLEFLNAAVRGDVSKVLKYLEEDPNLLNYQDKKTGRTAILEACLNDHVELVEALLNLSADVKDKTENEGGLSCFDFAVKNGNVKIVKLLIDKVDVNEETPKDGLRPIHRVCQGLKDGHVQILKMLLETKKVGANDVARTTMTPLQYVLLNVVGSQYRKPEKDVGILGTKRQLVQILLDNGADATKMTDDEITTLGLSFREIGQYQKRPAAKKILPNYRNSKKISADDRLHLAIQRGDLDLILHEIKVNNANINSKNPANKQTPLMTSVLKGAIDVVEALIDLGADPTIAEEGGYTPFHGAGFQGQAEVAKILIEKLNLDPNDMHKDGYRPIHRAIWGKLPRHAEFVEYLLSTGKVDVETRTETGLTPLQVLVSSNSYKNKDTARVLVKYGADVSVLTEQQIEELGLSSDDDFQTCPKKV